MGLHLLGHPIVEIMGRAIHRRREFSAIKARAKPPALHPFDHKHILGKDALPEVSVVDAHSLVNSGFCIVDVNMFYCAVFACWIQYDRKGMIALRTQKHIRIGRDILGSVIPFFTDVGEIRKNLAGAGFELTIDQRAPDLRICPAPRCCNGLPI